MGILISTSTKIVLGGGGGQYYTYAFFNVLFLDKDSDLMNPTDLLAGH